ncbi:MAG: PAS domain-containing protein, partial [Candidatus Lokiarchaeota archaeon]
KNIRFSINDKELIFNLRVQPALDIENGEDLYLMFFEHGSIKSEGITYNSSSGENLRNVDEIRTEQLEHELKSTRSQLNTTIEECETINEELKSTNEEYLSANEELKSTNEELQTSKEELQSINEELVTVNNELEAKIDELSNTNDDLRNLIQSTEIGTLFLDKDLKIRKFTESINKIFSIIETDEGRPLRDISSNLKNINIIEEAKKVLDNFIPIEKDVQIENELWYRLRINPYRTESKFIDGVVLTFMDITERKKIEQSLRKSETKFRDAFNQLKFYEDLFTHDMRNILQVISSSMELSIDKYENQTEEESKIILDSLHRTQNQVNRGHKLIDNVQKLSIIENSLENVYTRDLTSVIESAKKYIEDAFKNENVTFKISAYKQGIPVRASNLLEDVLKKGFFMKGLKNLLKEVWELDLQSLRKLLKCLTVIYGLKIDIKTIKFKELDL